ncbi:hypothetical protein N9733_05775 [Akkermansiaceae bacterium]|nr:hypothetical protein [Akkermansiaceae bacterium]
MNREFEELNLKRSKWIEANRENGFEAGINRLLTDLYPDNAHFIYELLQNAEDPCASKVRFKLSHDAVEFEHNGARLFDSEDVESITSIGTSTKRDDHTSIGKFGVGFKAVFAYTNTPEIHSGEFSFRIRDLVLPETAGVEKADMGKGQTRFILPFNHPSKIPAKAVDEVERALRSLGDNTLLFLSHIRTIEYALPDGSSGSLKRVDHDGGRIEIQTKDPSGKTSASNWLLFQKEVEVVDEDEKSQICSIAVAYKLEKNDEKKTGPPEWKIVPLDHGQVSIYFPAEKETSNLRFHIHAPFASTVARDSVRDCGSNHQLRDGIASLIVESFHSIRDQGLLRMGFLGVLPNEWDNLPPFYEPIHKAAVRAFDNEPLMPTKCGKHAPARKLYRGPAKISKVIDNKDLALLTGKKRPQWAANPPPNHQQEVRFLDSLQIQTFGWRELIKHLNFPHKNPYLNYHKNKNREHEHTIQDWIEGKKDAWLMKFYALMGEAYRKHDELPATLNLRIVRVEADGGTEHVLPREAYLPADEESPVAHDINFVKDACYNGGSSKSQKDYAMSFLERIGVRAYDEKSIIELKLKKYQNPPEKIDDDYYEDLKRFIAYWKKTDQTSIFRGNELFLSNEYGYFLLCGQKDDGDPVWRRPSSLCIDSPYEETGLAELSEIHSKDKLWDGYKDKFPESLLEDFIEFVKSIGVFHCLKITDVNIRQNPAYYELAMGTWRARNTSYAISRDYSIDQIEKYMEHQSVSASRLIWSALIRAPEGYARASYRPNKQCNISENKSQLVFFLSQSDWIPDMNGVFRKPQEMTPDDLLDDFPFDQRNGLLAAIGFGQDVRKRDENYQQHNKFAEEAGFGSADEVEKLGEFLKSKKITVDKIITDYASQQWSIAQPEESVPNPERRRKKVTENSANALKKESEIRERSIRPGAREEKSDAKTYLRAKYRNPEGLLICQCCHEVMPFKVKDEYYFEAVQCLRDLDSHCKENHFALCPNCAAMYRHARESDDQEIRRSIIELNNSPTAESAEITVRLARREFQLRFVGTHLFDLRTILQKPDGNLSD